MNKKLVLLEEYESILNKWRGSSVLVQMYHASLKRLLLRLSNPDEEKVLYLLAVDCIYMSGPFEWSDALIVTQKVSDSHGGWNCQIIDKNSAFKLICSSISLAIGSELEFDISFDGFLGPLD